METLLRAIHHCHENKVVHRDIKPHNIMFDTEGNIKLIDFGVSKLAKKSSVMDTEVGSPEFMAPEILIDRDYTK